ncbi:MAG TPA: helix-turn-helix transcriptional regulator [Ignavibacteria bacterium]
MITREDLLKSSEYWTEVIQNKIYSDFAEYVEINDIPNKQIAESLGLSKGRVSQILSGRNLNFRLDTLIKLCLTIDKIPDFHLIDVNEFIARDSKATIPIIFKDMPCILKPVDMTQRYMSESDSNLLRLNPLGLYNTIKTINNPEDPSTGTKAA